MAIVWIGFGAVLVVGFLWLRGTWRALGSIADLDLSPVQHRFWNFACKHYMRTEGRKLTSRELHNLAIFSAATEDELCQAVMSGKVSMDGAMEAMEAKLSEPSQLNAEVDAILSSGAPQHSPIERFDLNASQIRAWHSMMVAFEHQCGRKLKPDERIYFAGVAACIPFDSLELLNSGTISPDSAYCDAVRQAKSASTELKAEWDTFTANFAPPEIR